MSTTLVTGASGFVGSCLVRALTARGETVCALVRDPARAAQLRGQGVTVLVGDIRDPEAMSRAVQDVDVVHHCAAAVGRQFGERDFWEINVEGTRQVLDAARRAGCRRVVLLSSLHVLGIGDLDPATEELPSRRTRDPAANAKIDMEQMALEWARHGPTEVVILRPGVIYGPRDPANLPKLIAALRRGTFLYLGSRRHVVPIVHVSDVVAAMLLAARAPGAAGRIYHITDGSRTTIGNFVEHLADQAGCPRPRPWFLLPGFIVWPVLGLLNLVRRVYPRCPDPIKPGPLRFLATSRYVEIRRAREELGYAPRVDYRAGLADAVGGDSAAGRQGEAYAAAS
jgi:nucleoside-diphosphate-sugar epimerase